MLAIILYYHKKEKGVILSTTKGPYEDKKFEKGIGFLGI